VLEEGLTVVSDFISCPYTEKLHGFGFGCRNPSKSGIQVYRSVRRPIGHFPDPKIARRDR
jgi:hypothetical protein|tara:strand:- start:1085 stop:1264 length:180 start_codon:yes stop_codon:yes gene_type:complete